MKKQIIKRTIIFAITFVLIYIFNFFIPRLMPGDPIEKIENEAGQGLSTETIAEQRNYYGLDKPLIEQFFSTIKNNLTLNFGQSIYYKKSVSEVVFSRLPWTLYIMLTSIIISAIIGVFLAMATRRKRLDKQTLDNAVFTVMSILAEIPAFLIGALLLFLVAAKVPFIPLSNNLTAFYTHENIFSYLYDLLIHSLMPILAMVLTLCPTFYFVSRASFLSLEQKKFMIQAKAKGLSKFQINIKYLLLNTIFPIIATFFTSIGLSISGTILVENVFMYPGLGTVLQNAVLYSDYMLIQGVFLVSTIFVVVSSYLSDIINAIIGKSEI